jgi:hypothetical protein
VGLHMRQGIHPPQHPGHLFRRAPALAADPAHIHAPSSSAGHHLASWCTPGHNRNTAAAQSTSACCWPRMHATC